MYVCRSFLFREEKTIRSLFYYYYVQSLLFDSTIQLISNVTVMVKLLYPSNSTYSYYAPK